MKAVCIGALSACTFLSGSDTLGPNPSMKKVVEPVGKITPFKKPEFITKYNELVNNKATNKLVEAKKPMKLLSYDLLNNWKRAANLLVSAVNDDLSFMKYRHPQRKQDLAHYATALQQQIAELSKQATMLIEQYPIYSYKKPLFKKTAQYDEAAKTSARKKIKDASLEVQQIASRMTEIKIKILGILSNIPTDDKGRKNITAGQEEVYTRAANFADRLSIVTTNLANEINALQ